MYNVTVSFFIPISEKKILRLALNIQNNMCTAFNHSAYNYKAQANCVQMTLILALVLN